VIPQRFAEFLARLRRGVAERDRERLAAILQLNRALADAEDHSDLLVLLLDAAVALFGAERGFVVLREGDLADFHVEVARSLDREAVRKPRQKISSTVVRQCLEQKVGVFSEDAREGDFGTAQSVADLKLRSVLCMPLVVGDRCLGCVYLDHRFQSGVFQEADLPWFQAFADQGAIALHLHQLAQENKRHAEVVEARNRDLQATVRSQAEVLHRLQPITRDQLEYEYDEILGESAALVHCLHVLDRVMRAEFPVLLTGESGTGKELAARALHEYGSRRAKNRATPFVPLHIAAVNPNLLESELFGHVRGAFTGADQHRKGLLQQADGGVLFLDEVTEMDPDIQVKLLRFLEDSVVRPVGSDQTHKVDLRVVAATNRDVLEMVESGGFRRDLYYRLAVVTVEVPALAERRDDIPMLVERFFAAAAADRGADRPVAPTADLLRELTRRPWPGNLRQLKNEVLRLDALAEDGIADVALLSPEPALRGGDALALDLATVERQAVERAMRSAGGNKAAAARLLGISRRALYNKLDRIGDSE
jgi:DNA-binding NtrC family response regulator